MANHARQLMHCSLPGATPHTCVDANILMDHVDFQAKGHHRLQDLRESEHTVFGTVFGVVTCLS